MICSFSFTFLGLTLGKHINKILKTYNHTLFGKRPNVKKYENLTI